MRLPHARPLVISLAACATAVLAVPVSLHIHDVVLEMRLGNSALHLALHSPEWMRLRLNMGFSSVRAALRSQGEPGLPKVRLYVPEQARRRLMDDLPASAKSWQKAYMMYPDGMLRRVKVRHRGDNPDNWIFPKKAWRVKTRKTATLNNVRTRIFIVPENPALIEWPFLVELGNDMGIRTPPTRLVELYINEKYEGVYAEVFHLDETFLRNHGFMPVNLYKGEQRMGERRFGADWDLGNNPAIWAKLAVNNQRPPDDRTDLAYFLDLVRRAETSPRAFNELEQAAPIGAWARVAAFETITRNVLDAVHNLRLIVDTWSGTVLPILHDPHFVEVHSGEDVPMYWSTSRISILRLYSQYSAFVLAKQERIFDAVQPGGAVDRAIRRFRSQRDRIRASAERDPNFGQHMLFSTDLNLWSFEFDAYFDRYLRSFETTRDTLRSNLAEFPRGSWWPEAGGVRVVTRGPTALDSVQFRLVRGSPHPTQVAWDVDADGTFGPADLPLPFHISGGNVVVEATFMPNFLRFMTRNSLVRAQHYQSLIALQPAVFHIVADVPLNVDGVRARNPLTAESRALSKIPDEGMVPTRWNVPVTTKPRNLEETWSGRVVVNEDRVVGADVTIVPGTEVALAPGASLVFRNKVRILGTTAAPVRFTPLDPSAAPWGTVALHGQGTTGSEIVNVHMTGGSGDRIGLTDYIAIAIRPRHP